MPIAEAWMTVSPMKQPSAVIPIAMSLAALGTVLLHIAVYGVAREADEGTAAHIWQLLMAGQLPVILFFAFTWLPKAPARALQILAAQFGAALAALAPVYWLGL
jgi:hypothetical protein